MKVLLIDNGTNLLQKLQMLIPGVEVTHRFNEFTSGDVELSDLIVLSGSSGYSPIIDREKFSKEIDLIIQDKKPLIGICFGCELIAEAFGGKIAELSEKQHGIKEIEIMDPTLSDELSVKVYEGHKCVISEVPLTFEILAQSPSGPEIIKHKNLPIYGLQFHPENLVENAEGDELFMRLLTRF